MTEQRPPAAHEPAGIEPPPAPPPFVTEESLPGLVRAVRRRADKSQRELATAAGVARSTVAKLETGDLAPSLTTLFRDDPMPQNPDSPLWRRRRAASPTDRDFT